MADGTFQKNIQTLTNPTYNVNDMPKGISSTGHEWNTVYVDTNLLFLKYFKKEYHAQGKKEKFIREFSMVGTKKNVRISTIYSPFKIIHKEVLASKFKHERNKPPLIWQFKNIFVPVTREDIHLLMMNVVDGDNFFNSIVVDYSNLTAEDLSNLLPEEREKRVFNFLGIRQEKKDKKVKQVDASGKKLDQHTLDLFQGQDDEESQLMGFRNPKLADVGISNLKPLSLAHKMRAAVLMINRAKATLAKTKDPEKRQQIKSALTKWAAFKRKLDKEADEAS